MPHDCTLCSRPCLSKNQHLILHRAYREQNYITKVAARGQVLVMINARSTRRMGGQRKARPATGQFRAASVGGRKGSEQSVLSYDTITST